METTESDFKVTFIHPKKEKLQNIKDLFSSQEKNLKFYFQQLGNQRIVGIRGSYYGFGLFEVTDKSQLNTGSSTAESEDLMIIDQDDPIKTLINRLPDFIDQYYPQIAKKFIGKTTELDLGFPRVRKFLKRSAFKVKF